MIVLCLIFSAGYFVEPTVILAKTPHYKSIEEEIFGPVLTVYVYPADKYEETVSINVVEQIVPNLGSSQICCYLVDSVRPDFTLLTDWCTVSVGF